MNKPFDKIAAGLADAIAYAEGDHSRGRVRVVSGEQIDFENGDALAGASMKHIRQAAGLSIRELADLMYYRDIDGLRQMEHGKRPISGPVRLILEMLHDGRLDPDSELDAEVGGN